MFLEPSRPQQHGCAGTGGGGRAWWMGCSSTELNFSSSNSSCSEGFVLITRADRGEEIPCMGCPGRAVSLPVGDGDYRSPSPTWPPAFLHGRGFSSNPRSWEDPDRVGGMVGATSASPAAPSLDAPSVGCICPLSARAGTQRDTPAPRAAQHITRHCSISSGVGTELTH